MWYSSCGRRARPSRVKVADGKPSAEEWDGDGGGTVLRGGVGTHLGAGAGVHFQAVGVFAVGYEEGVHSAGGLQAGDSGAVVEGFAGTDGDEVFRAVHDAGHEDAVAEAEVFQVGGKAEVDHLGGAHEKGV